MHMSLIFTMVASAAAHGQMTFPPSRNGGSLQLGSDFSASKWYLNGTLIPGAATLPHELWSIDEDRAKTWPFSKNPWKAPGTASVLSPCGTGCSVSGVPVPAVGPCAPSCDGGDPWDPISSPECKDVSTKVDGRDLPKTERTSWEQGGVAEVAWAISANHAGGYAFRLCPAWEVTDEACFQEHHLEFADDVHTIQWTKDGTEEVIPAKRTKVGTYPAGSHWSMNPIPTDEGPQPFPQPCSLRPCQGSPAIWSKIESFSIKDRVKVPNDLVPGNYTLSWRWDCEVSSQVWTNCADITIQAAASVVV